MADAGQTLEIDWVAGSCPVQAEGKVDGRPFYFRARGDSWSLSVGHHPLSDPEWRHKEDYGTWPDAGWIDEAEARRLIDRGVAIYRTSRDGAAVGGARP